jgi:hypothetical protein
MKTLLFLLFASISPLFPTTVSAQAAVALEDVCRAIGNGNVRELAAVMDTEVELNILSKEDLYSKAEAVAALKAFFGEVNPSSFGKVHQGASKSADAEYCIGTLATAKGPFTVYVYVAKRANGVVLQELRFEK